MHFSNGNYEVKNNTASSDFFFCSYTCVYLACKVEEFNVSIQQFVANCHGDKEKAADIILSHELLLMHELQYHLTIHNPFRPLEGLLIDIKVKTR